MPTATASKSKTPPAESWSAWLDQLDQLQHERAEITGQADARERLTRASNLARHVIGLAVNNAHYPGRFEHSAAEDDTETLMELMEQIHHDMKRASKAVNWHDQSAERQAYIKTLTSKAGQAIRDLESAAAEVRDLEQARAEADQRIESLEKAAPKASATSLAALRKERDAAADECDRITRTLDALTADDSPLTLAHEGEQAARERLEEAEALLALGEANAEDVKAARAEADKARKALEEREAERRTQDAARRGMARKREQAESKRATLDRAYRHALGRVRHADLAALESELVTDLERLATDHLKALAEIYADLEEAEPGADYGKAVIDVKLPHLYHHPERDTIRFGLTITANGRGE